LIGRGDLACLALGSMLPDMIDKPLSLIIYGTPAMGRSVSHTFLFLLVMATIAFYLKNLRLASVSGGVLAHLFLDSIWISPAIFLWPLLGNFPLSKEQNIFDYMLNLLLGLRNPEILIPEVLGLAYLIYFSFRKRSAFMAYLKRAAIANKAL
jgi:hypothetical protein